MMYLLCEHMCVWGEGGLVLLRGRWTMEESVWG